MFLSDKKIDSSAYLEIHNDWGVDDFEFAECKSLIKNFRTDAEYTMRKDCDEERVLYDRVKNGDGLLVVSTRFKDILTGLDCGNVEYLKITILDQRDQKYKKPHYIVNLIGSVNYIDQEKSIIKMSRLDKDRIRSIKKLVVKNSIIPDGRVLFRAANFPNVVVVSDEFKRLTEDHKLEGLRFIDTDDYNSVTHGK